MLGLVGYDVGLIYNCDLVVKHKKLSEGREFDSRSGQIDLKFITFWLL